MYEKTRKPRFSFEGAATSNSFPLFWNRRPELHVLVMFAAAYRLSLFAFIFRVSPLARAQLLLLSLPSCIHSIILAGIITHALNISIYE